MGTKDIHVVTNYGNVDLASITTISQLKETKTPAVNKTNNLNTATGFCMYGMTSAYDFVNSEDSYVNVTVERTCAKMRFTMSFPDDPDLSTDNSFLITNAASYTYIIETIGGIALPSESYFNFAAPLELVSNVNGEYIGTTYVYEASSKPTVYFYTHFSGSTEEQTFITTLPLPVRNYFYDIIVQIYEDNDTRTMRRNYRIKTEITVYDGNGKIIS
ncbi:MAG: hypothetical protein LUF90_05120 [Rikenellaceae bacterium]|nr:hypothetical protein [Rikenellaceae bacterium]